MIRSALNSVALPGRALISPYCGRIPPVLSPSLPVAGAVRSLQLMRTHPAPQAGVLLGTARLAFLLHKLLYFSGLWV